jgi:hypothetical protein
VRIIDPYREDNERTLRWLDSLTHEARIELLKRAGILGKNGKLARRYRTPKESNGEPNGTRRTAGRKGARKRRA